MQTGINTNQLKKQFRFYFTTGVGLLTAISMWQTVKYQLRIVQNKNKTRFIKTGQVSRLNQVTQEQVGKTILLMGAVETLDQKCFQQTISKKKENLALHLKYKETIFSNQSYDLTKNNYHIKLKDVLKGNCLLRLNDGICLKEGAVKFRLKNLDRVDFSNALDILLWDNKMRKLTFSQDLQAFFLSLLRGVATVAVKDNQVSFLRGLDIGDRQVDAGIRIGTTLTVLGSIGISSQGQFFIQPTAVFKQRFSFLNQLSQKLEQLVSKRNVWLGALVIGSIYLGRRAYNYIKKNNIHVPIINPLKRQVEKGQNIKQMNQQS